jgi:hypothetical protein
MPCENCKCDPCICRMPIPRMPIPGRDPAWIRDTTAADLTFHATPSDLAAMCEGEQQFCSLCGAVFPLWPMREWAQHTLDVHADNLTNQQIEFYAEVAKTAVSNQSMLMLQGHLVSRVSLRRRAAALGVMKPVALPGGPRIIRPGERGPN